MKENYNHLSNPEQIKQFYYELQQKHGIQDKAPKPYQDTAFDELKGLVNTIFETVFLYSGFGYVKPQELYDFYLDAGGKLGKKNFFNEIRDLIKGSNNNWKEDNKKMNGSSIPVRGFYNSKPFETVWNYDLRKTLCKINSDDWSIPFDVKEIVTKVDDYDEPKISQDNQKIQEDDKSVKYQNQNVKLKEIRNKLGR